MTIVCRNETSSAQRPLTRLSGLVATGLSTLLVATVCLVTPARAQEEELVPLACADGTNLVALFGDKDVEITLPEGASVTLPQTATDPWKTFSNGKFQLMEKGDVLEWTVGKKAPVLCTAEDEDVPTQFDAPIGVDNTDLPPDTVNPDAKPVVNCYRFKGFMIKEVDLGEVGADKIAVLPETAACEKDSKDEKAIADDMAGYFLGTKGSLLFLQAPDGFNGGVPFVVYDTKTMKALFYDSFEGADFKAINVDGDKVTLQYRRNYTASCSLYLDGGNCPAEIRKEAGLADILKLPDCGPSYDAEKKRTPDFAKEIEKLPSVISYEAELTFDGKDTVIKPLPGDITCRPVD